MNENYLLNRFYEKGKARTDAVKVDNLQHRFVKINKDIFSEGDAING